jgi:AbiTii-like protein
MALIENIIDLAVDRTSSISDLLRKCLVLAYELDNEKLKAWVENELDGYRDDDVVPDYRTFAAHAKGLFVGWRGAQINNQPLPSFLLKQEHRHWAETITLREPIAAYEGLIVREADSKLKENPIVEWPANLTAIYQDKFLRGYTLNRAWLELPRPAIIAFIDLVRNKTLRFALELRKQIGSSKADFARAPPEKVDQIVTNNIFGGNVVIATHAQHFSQTTTTIATGDRQSLANALGQLGVSESGIGELIEATTQDRLSAPDANTLGDRTLAVLQKVAASGLKVGVEIAKPVLTAMLMQYSGLSHS